VFVVYLETVWVRCLAELLKFHKRESNGFYGFQHFAVDAYRLANSVVTFLY
jgi:hypothetical protein